MGVGPGLRGVPCGNKAFKVVVQGGKKNIVLPQRWADSTVKSPFEEVGLICHWAMEEAAMQKPPDYKEIISSNPLVVLHRLAAILHCLSYLFPACISSPVSFYYSSHSIHIF